MHIDQPWQRGSHRNKEAVIATISTFGLPLNKSTPMQCLCKEQHPKSKWSGQSTLWKHRDPYGHHLAWFESMQPSLIGPGSQWAPIAIGSPKSWSPFHLWREPCLSSLYKSSEKPCLNRSPLTLPNSLWELMKHLCRNKDQPLVFPFWGECLKLFLLTPTLSAESLDSLSCVSKLVYLAQGLVSLVLS